MTLAGLDAPRRDSIAAMPVRIEEDALRVALVASLLTAGACGSAASTASVTAHGASDASAHDATHATDGRRGEGSRDAGAIDAPRDTSREDRTSFDGGVDAPRDVFRASEDAPASDAPTHGRDAGAPAASVTLFGGVGYGTDGGFSALGDTWVWNGREWAEAATAGPSARRCAAMATFGDGAVLFGGTSDPSEDAFISVDVASMSVFADTWAWSGERWTLVSSAGPSARYGASMAELDGTLVLFGGDDGSGGLGDTWGWDGVRWTQYMVTGPSPRAYAGMATLDGAIVLFGGISGDGEPGVVAGSYDDTWLWDGTAWVELVDVDPPGWAGPTAMATVGPAVVMLGGDRGPPPIGTTYLWNGASWSTPDGGALAPPPYWFSSMATLAETAVYFPDQGTDGDGGTTYTWADAGWSALAGPGPYARYFAAMASVP
jgi:hypothetical protein